MYKNKNFDKVNGEMVVRKIISEIYTQYRGIIGIDGPNSSGKTILMEEVAFRLAREGFVRVDFDFKKFINGKDLLKNFLGNILLNISEFIGAKFLYKFSKENNIKSVNKIKKNNTGYDIDLKFNVNHRTKDKDFQKENLLTIIKSFDKFLNDFGIRTIICFDNLFDLEKSKIKVGYDFFESISLIAPHIIILCTINNDKLDQKDQKISFKKIFGNIYDLQKNFKTYEHNNIQIKNFIKLEKIKNLKLIETINEDLLIVEKWLKRSYDFHFTEEDTKKYFNELCFLYWVLKYYSFVNIDYISLLKEKIELLTDLRKGRRFTDINQYPNLHEIAMCLREEDYGFKNKNKILEVINMIENRFLSNIPIALIYVDEKNYNIVNEMMFLFIFDCKITKTKSILNKNPNITLLIQNNTLVKETKMIIELLKKRTVEEFENEDLDKRFFNHYFEVISNYFELEFL
ncbi:hypothetical protein SHELI_v1c06180 [Spiroplasma helicoides]|uniref:KAP NTPase domain-containing protein n=1 Tax=Spiroplasma helicoides TaxID=216938 RepID=A0A1B3SKV4_9MOLU|nr:ATP-binding protein [Spiroplasma helicoides]AOG60569.1 hypothetical protein SHELI_v1c06180 [Spiroplasma helicoides]